MIFENGPSLSGGGEAEITMINRNSVSNDIQESANQRSIKMIQKGFLKTTLTLVVLLVIAACAPAPRRRQHHRPANFCTTNSLCGGDSACGAH
jgi:hypothetical protein